MRRNGLIGLLFTVAVALFIIPLVPPALQTKPSPAPRVAPEALPPRQEAKYKQMTVKRDMEATERLARAQIVRDIRNFVQAGSIDQAGLSKLLRTHPEIREAQWLDGQNRLKDGTVSAGLNKTAERYRSHAANALRSGNPYASPTFRYEGKSFFIHSQPGKKKGQGLITLVSTEVIQSVEKHQRRNMRLIPYPAEGRYRIESVLPNTQIDTTVKSGEDNGNASHYSVDEIVVKFRSPLTSKQLLDLRRELQLTVVRHTRQTYVFRSKKFSSEQLRKYFLDKWNPVFAEPHYLYLTNETAGDSVDESKPIIPNDTLYSEYQWNLPEIAAEFGWNVSKGSPDIVVAVVDTGVQSDHPDLAGRLVEGINVVDPSSPPEDDVGHGTHVAGIIAAEINNNEGVAGMTWYTKIMPVKVLDSTGAGSTYSVAEGIIWATDHGANIINMSLGNYADAEFLHDALKYAYDHGVLLVAASGNDNTDRPGYPAAYPEVVAVAATDPDGARAEYSNYGDYIDVAAPGTSIPSTYPGSRYAALSGTSMACPHVAALASLIRAVNPQLGNDEVMELLRRTAKDLGTAGKDPNFGYGEIDVLSALRTARSTSTSLQLYPQQVRRQLEKLK